MTEDADASHDTTDIFTVVTTRVTKSLKGFTNDYPEWSEQTEDLEMSTFKPHPSDFPVPDLIKAVIVNTILQNCDLGLGRDNRCDLALVVDPLSCRWRNEANEAQNRSIVGGNVPVHNRFVVGDTVSQPTKVIKR